MPHFHFDTLCGQQFTRDADGLYFSRLSDAIREAKRSLGELARDCVHKMDNGTMVVWVRDEKDAVLFTASLQLNAYKSTFADCSDLSNQVQQYADT